MLLHYFASPIFIITKVICQNCMQDAIRLEGGQTELEGRVEICRNGYWGRVCGYRWGQYDALVVCRQLGFLAEGAMPFTRAQFGSGSGQILLAGVHCTGHEQTLIECDRSGQNYCRYSKDPGVRCKGLVIVELNITDVSVLVSWQSNPMAIKYDVLIMNTINNRRYNVVTEISNTESVFKQDDLIPEQNYTICVTGYYEHSQEDSSCGMFQTQTIVHKTSANLTLGIFGFIIAVLVFLLIVAGAALAYPRCIRHRVKDKKYLSNISQFLDKTMYLTSNEAYIERTQQLTANQGTSHSGGAEIYIPPTYEATPDPPTTQPTPGEPRHGPSISQVTAEIVALHYEMCECRQPKNLAPEARVPQQVPAK